MQVMAEARTEALNMVANELESMRTDSGVLFVAKVGSETQMHVGMQDRR